MKLEIVQILDRGIANKERLWLRAMAEVNLTYYIVLNTTYLPNGNISNLEGHTYWFSPMSLKIGDQVVLYTSPGKSNQEANDDGTTTHFLYWGAKKTKWNNQSDCAVLLEVNRWQTSKRGE